MNYEFEKKKLYAFLGKRLLTELKGQKCYIAGGTITSLFCRREINDIDIYFKSEEAIVDFVGSIWGGGWIVANTSKATLIRYKNQQDIQLIHFKYFPTVNDIFETFDFTVCMAAFDFETEEFVFHPQFMQHNSQRILKFNSNTAFPIVSLLRVQKYKDKGYTISKPEFLRIALICMNLKINTYEELKEQMGGMYGINYDKLFKDMNGAVDLVEAVSRIENLILDDTYFNVPENEGKEMGDLDEFLESFSTISTPFIEVNKKIYKIFNGNLRGSYTVPKNGHEVDRDEFFKNKKFYKFVEKKDDDTYRSFYDNSFKYIIGETAIARGSSYSSNPVLYFNDLNNISQSTYKTNKNKVLLEAEIEDISDFVNYSDNAVTLKKCKIIREVPLIEYMHYLDENYEEDDLFGL
jgi:hypothetical protein